MVWKLMRGYCLCCYYKALFASARLHRVQKMFILKSAKHYSSYLKLNNTIAQRKTTNIKRNSFIYD